MTRRLSTSAVMLLALLTAVVPMASPQPPAKAGPTCCCATSDPDSDSETSCRCCADDPDPATPCDCGDYGEGFPLVIRDTGGNSPPHSSVTPKRWSVVDPMFRQQPWVTDVAPAARSGPDVFVWNCVWLI